MAKTITELNEKKDKLYAEFESYVQENPTESDGAVEILNKITCIENEIKKIGEENKKTEALKKSALAKQYKLKALWLAIPSFLLVLFVILTIVLNISTVFNGTYKGENPLTTDYKYEVAFSGKTVTYTLSKESEWQHDYFGFYQKVENVIELNLTTPSEETEEFKRKNVFTLTKTVYAMSIYGNPIMGMPAEMELKCYGAIWLQVFYSVGTVASAVFLIVQIIRKRKAKK